MARSPSHPIASLWEPFGLRSSPFFQDELKPSDTQEHPISLFVGRAAEVQRVLRRIRSDSSSRTIVQGEPGIGKTSFVNRIKAEAVQLGIATHQHPVRVTSDTTRSSFVADILRALARIRISVGGRSKAGDAFWGRTVRRLEGGEIHAGGLSAAGFGVSLSRSLVAQQAAGDALYEELGRALELLHQETGGPALLHVNNLENLSAEDARSTAVLLLDLRDYFLIPGAHWVFAGSAGIEDQVFRVFDQVGGIFPAAESLDPLPPERVEELLALRYTYLGTRARVVPPIKPAHAARLYALYQGDLRNFLRLLGDAAERGLGIEEIRAMTPAEVIRSVAADYARRLRRTVGEGDYAYLELVFDASRERGGEFRVTDAARILPITQASASELVIRLLAHRAIRKVRTVGRSTYYRPAGEALVAFGADPASMGLARG